MSVELQDLRVFVAVASQGSFRRAAGMLFQAQPSISARISALERVVGTELFHRGTRGVRLTPAGEALLPYAQRCISLAEEAVFVARAGDQVSRFHIAIPATFSATVIPFALKALEGLPLRVSCYNAHTHEVIQLVVDGVASVGFVLPSPVPAGIVLDTLFVDPVVCVCGRHHTLASAGRVKIEDLAGSQLAVNAWGDGAAAFLQLLADVRFPEQAIRTVSPAETAAILARNHDHVSFLTSSTVRDDLANGALILVQVEDLPDWGVPVALAYRERDFDQPAVQALLADPTLHAQSQGHPADLRRPAAAGTDAYGLTTPG
jgi:DNA-binding transcriptional LysR family regulator